MISLTNLPTWRIQEWLEVQTGEQKIQDAIAELEDFISKYFIIVEQTHTVEVSAELRQRIAAVAAAALASRRA